MATTQFTKDDLIEALERYDMDADSVRVDYSGRGMYGSNCFGIVHSGSSADVTLALMIAMHDAQRREFGSPPDLYEVLDAVGEITRCASGDSMGMDQITYFPGWQLPIEEED